ncbi:putative transcriptional regulator, Crp/Fnr family [Thalassoporum mexicanum PCC 7367]|nr:cyclic nucleotide-binding domain-containing protein [Pseudanabaena sp. PCC 7367]AFY68418.1 putative transcriptional regulator, Crp/Fnr family [Pseudanabaena sp. PCC 7367]
MKPIKTIEAYQKPPSPKTYAAGEIIFSQGETGSLMYGVISGEVEMQLNSKVIETISMGDVFGAGALVHDDHLRTSTAIAKTECLIGFLDQKHFLFAIQQTPMFAIEVMRSYSDRFRRLKELF